MIGELLPSLGAVVVVLGLLGVCGVIYWLWNPGVSTEGYRAQRLPWHQRCPWYEWRRLWFIGGFLLVPVLIMAALVPLIRPYAFALFWIWGVVSLVLLLPATARWIARRNPDTE